MKRGSSELTVPNIPFEVRGMGAKLTWTLQISLPTRKILSNPNGYLIEQKNHPVSSAQIPDPENYEVSARLFHTKFGHFVTDQKTTEAVSVAMSKVLLYKNLKPVALGPSRKKLEEPQGDC